jgi:hypothetical protein
MFDDPGMDGMGERGAGMLETSEATLGGNDRAMLDAGVTAASRSITTVPAHDCARFGCGMLGDNRAGMFPTMKDRAMTEFGQDDDPLS